METKKTHLDSSPAKAAAAPHWLLWGKATRPEEAVGPEWHPLICHMLDVMHVADLMWERMPAAARRVLVEPFGEEEAARAWMRVLVMLHDTGKATPGFQFKWDGNLLRQEAAGLVNKRDKECHRHGTSGTALLGTWLADRAMFGASALPPRVATSLARAVAAHHGEFAGAGETDACGQGDIPRWMRHGVWRTAHQELVKIALKYARRGVALTGWTKSGFPDPGYVIALAGLTSVADWLGSDASVFVYEPLPVAIDEYIERSRQRALTVLENVGWRHLPSSAPRSFVELFPQLTPRSLQTTLAEVLDSLTGPSLVVLESTMGDGKTEAALLVSESLAPKVGQAGLYIGLPTQATANQMFGRTRRFLERTADAANLQLVHGDAALSDEFRALKLRAIYGDGNSPQVAAEAWFAQSKRSLLASHAVGTVDQGLMGILKTKHGFVRLFGLAGKTVILDEVHAYDTYTSELLDRLVAWLSHLGTTVVILSATLPRTRRMQLVEAYGGHAPEAEAPYPRITAVSRGSMALSTGTQPSRPAQRIELARKPDDTEALADQLIAAVANGGCAVWICNTVRRAQEAFVALQRLRDQQRGLEDLRLDLLHSRCLRKDRQERERCAESLYGPQANKDTNPARPHRSILVGTQVLEQSLDLDFDLMVSDLAPIDLLLQRSGRLHRHNRSARPAGLETPTMWLVVPDENAGVPNFAQVARVYAADIMFKTWWELRDTRAWDIPASLESWVERVYGDEGTTPADPALVEALNAASEKATSDRGAMWAEARRSVLFHPKEAEKSDAFAMVRAELEEDESGERHASLVAKTRLAKPSADVVCLWENGDQLTFDREGTHPANLCPTSFAELKLFLQHSLKLELWRLKSLGECASQPKEWEENASLRFKRLLRLGERSDAAGVRLDAQLGIVFDHRRREDL